MDEAAAFVAEQVGSWQADVVEEQFGAVLGVQPDLVQLADAGSRGISLLVVERGMPGFTRGRKLDKIGLHAQDTAELFFDDVPVLAADLLGHEGGGSST